MRRSAAYLLPNRQKLTATQELLTDMLVDSSRVLNLNSPEQHELIQAVSHSQCSYPN